MHDMSLQGAGTQVLCSACLRVNTSSQVRCACQGQMSVSAFEREMHWCTALGKVAKPSARAA